MVCLAMQYHVHKFGGSSLASADGYIRVAKILLRLGQANDCVVVSASSKTTNVLLATLAAYEQDQPIAPHLDHIFEHQAQLIFNCFQKNAPQQLIDTLDQDLRMLRSWFAQPLLSSNQRNQIASMGELWSARLLSALLNQMEAPTQWFHTVNLIITTQETTSIVDEIETQARLQAVLAQHPRQRLIFTGFVCGTQEGEHVLLGRNGSDYSATLIAKSIQAEAVHIWTDVCGLYNADPHRIAQAQKLESITFQEADKLAKLGCKALHQKTLQPLQGVEILINIRSSFEPDAGFTQITTASTQTVEPIMTSINSVALLTIETHTSIEQLVSLLRSVGLPPLTFKRTYQGALEIAVAPEYLESTCQWLKAHGADYQLNQEYGLVGLISRKAEAFHAQFRRLLSRRAKPLFADENSLVTLVPKQQVNTLLQQVHQHCTSPQKQIGLVLMTNQPQSLQNLHGLYAKKRSLGQQLHAEIKFIVVANQTHWALDLDGLDLANHWTEQWQTKHQDYTLQTLLATLSSTEFDEIVIIDCLAYGELAYWYPEFIGQGCHVISTDNAAATPLLPLYRRLQSTLQQHRTSWAYDTSMSTAFSVSELLQTLHARSIQNLTMRMRLSTLLSPLHAHTIRHFSQHIDEILYETSAQQVFEELNGQKMQRDLVMVARELGLEVEMCDVAVEPFLPAEFHAHALDNLLEHQKQIDAWYQQKIQSVQAKRWCYLAEIKKSNTYCSLSVGWRLLETQDLFLKLQPNEHALEFHDLSKPSPFFIKGCSPKTTSFNESLARDIESVCSTARHCVTY
jgi:aspartokinase/homoserine dehydrogenase 2